MGALSARSLFSSSVALPGVLGVGIPLAAALATGYPYFRDRLRSLSRSSPANTDTLITTGTAASFLLGEQITGLIVLWLLNLDELIESFVLRQTRRAIGDLLYPIARWPRSLARRERQRRARAARTGEGR